MSVPVIERQHAGNGPPAGARSAYPPRIAELVPKALALAAELGEVPSRNRLMSELRVGAPKATALRSALLDDAEPVSASAGPGPAPRSTLQAPAAGSAPVEPGPGPVPTRPVRDREPAPALTGPGTGAAERGAEPAGSGTEPGTVGKWPGLATGRVDPDPIPMSGAAPDPVRRVAVWPVLLLAAPAFVAIWSGWVGLGALTGFGTVRPLPGIWDSLTINTAITLPIGVETYAAYALRAWLTPGVAARARRFARASAIGALCLGALGQIAYHLMAAAEVTAAPWQITTLVSCLPVAVLGMGAALIHLLNTDDGEVAR
jgi:hypothetical protein